MVSSRYFVVANAFVAPCIVPTPTSQQPLVAIVHYSYKIMVLQYLDWCQVVVIVVFQEYLVGNNNQPDGVTQLCKLPLLLPTLFVESLCLTHTLHSSLYSYQQKHAVIVLEALALKTLEKTCTGRKHNSIKGRHAFVPVRFCQSTIKCVKLCCRVNNFCESRCTWLTRMVF